jgi:hypothetical protein
MAKILELCHVFVNLNSKDVDNLTKERKQTNK